MQKKQRSGKRRVGYYLAVGILSGIILLMSAFFIYLMINPPSASTPPQISHESEVSSAEITPEPDLEIKLTAEPDTDNEPAAIPDQPGSFIISDFGDSFYYYGRTDSSRFDDAFDMSILDGWTYAATPIGYSSIGGSRLDGIYDGDIKAATLIEPGSSPAERGSDEPYTWTYFKKEFQLPQNIKETISDMDISGQHRIDDALIIYINGIEVYRYNTGIQSGYGDSVEIGQQPVWDSYQGYDSDPTTRAFTINSDYDNRLTAYPGKTFVSAVMNGVYENVQRILRDAASRTNFNKAVQDGTNVLTAAVGQTISTDSPDLFFDLKLTAARNPDPLEYTIINPYSSVNWNRYNQYKAALHCHSTNSIDSDAGNATARDMVLDHYNKGYDILALTDHNYLTRDWLSMRNPLTASEYEQIRSGTFNGPFPGAGAGALWAVGQTRRTGMIYISNTNEQSYSNHINTYFAGILNNPDDTAEYILRRTENAGGLSQINHPGRYTGSRTMDLVEGMLVSHDDAYIDNCVDLYTEYISCIGIEIYSRIDYTSLSDRIVWDNILMKTMPEGRFVWGLATDDAHSMNAAGYNFVMMLMPDLSETEARISLETGAFYSVARVDRREEINIFNHVRGGSYLSAAWGDYSTLHLLEQTTPRITDITVSGSTITVTGIDFDVIEWISDGVKIHTEYRNASGNKLNLNNHQNRVGNYVRAQLKSETGIACTQPFGIVLN